MLYRESTMKRQRRRTRVEAERKELEDNFYIHVIIHTHMCLCHYIMGYINKQCHKLYFHIYIIII